jgi:hypothetical protein
MMPAESCRDVTEPACSGGSGLWPCHAASYGGKSTEGRIWWGQDCSKCSLEGERARGGMRRRVFVSLEEEGKRREDGNWREVRALRVSTPLSRHQAPSFRIWFSGLGALDLNLTTPRPCTPNVRHAQSLIGGITSEGHRSTSSDIGQCKVRCRAYGGVLLLRLVFCPSSSRPPSPRGEDDTFAPAPPTLSRRLPLRLALPHWSSLSILALALALSPLSTPSPTQT